jgi:hypothetical protein
VWPCAGSRKRAAGSSRSSSATSPSVAPISAPAAVPVSQRCGGERWRTSWNGQRGRASIRSS